MTETAPMTTGQYLQARRIKTHRPGATVKYIAISIGATERQVRAALDLHAPHRPTAAARNKNAMKRLRPGLKVSGYQRCGHRKDAGIPEIPRRGASAADVDHLVAW